MRSLFEAGWERVGEVDAMANMDGCDGFRGGEVRFGHKKGGFFMLGWTPI